MDTKSTPKKTPIQTIISISESEPIFDMGTVPRYGEALMRIFIINVCAGLSRYSLWGVWAVLGRSLVLIFIIVVYSMRGFAHEVDFQ